MNIKGIMGNFIFKLIFVNYFFHSLIAYYSLCCLGNKSPGNCELPFAYKSQNVE